MKKVISVANGMLLQKHKAKELCKGSQWLLQKQQDADLNRINGNFTLELMQHLANQKKEEAEFKLLYPWLSEKVIHRKN